MIFQLRLNFWCKGHLKKFALYQTKFLVWFIRLNQTKFLVQRPFEEICSLSAGHDIKFYIKNIRPVIDVKVIRQAALEKNSGFRYF